MKLSADALAITTHLTSLEIEYDLYQNSIISTNLDTNFKLDLRSHANNRMFALYQGDKLNCFYLLDNLLNYLSLQRTMVFSMTEPKIEKKSDRCRKVKFV